MHFIILALVICRTQYSDDNRLAAMPRGIVNESGNNCYAASALQLLSSSDALRTVILGSDFIRCERPIFLRQFRHVLRTLCALTAAAVVDARVIYDLRMSSLAPFNSTAQQDTAEYIEFIFNTLNETLPYKGQKIDEAIRFESQYRIVCSQCQRSFKALPAKS